MRQFKVCLQSLDIALVSFDEKIWRFEYVQDYHYVHQFPAFKVYESESLWIMFKIRIPPKDRADVRKQIEKLGIDSSDKFEMFMAFGKKVIYSPYLLKRKA